MSKENAHTTNAGTKEILKHNKGTLSFSDVASELVSDTSKVLQKLQKNVIPLDVLPVQFQELINQLADRYKFPKLFSLMYLIYAFSIAIGNNYRIRIKKNWIEPAILYMAVVGLPGQTKTPVQSFFMAVFKDLDRVNFEQWKAEIKEWEIKKKAATKQFPFEDEKPKRKQILLQDYTPEALIKTLSDNWHGAGLMLDELAMLFGNMNRYNNGNEVPMWLSFFNALAYSLNRKTSDDLYVAHPFISVIGGIQQGILKKLFTGDMLINGWADRYIYGCAIDVRKEVPGDEEVDTHLIDAYTDAVKFLLATQPKTVINEKGKEVNIPRLLDFTPEAKRLYYDYRVENAEQVNNLNDEGAEMLAGMYSKFDYHAIRLSFILQVLTDACNGQAPAEITDDAVRGGIRLADYFKHHTNRVQALISKDPLAAYDEKKKGFYMALPNSFTTGEAIKIAQELRQDEIGALVTSESVEKWAKRFIDCELFTKPSHGNYQKLNK